MLRTNFKWESVIVEDYTPTAMGELDDWQSLHARFGEASTCSNRMGTFTDKKMS